MKRTFICLTLLVLLLGTISSATSAQRSSATDKIEPLLLEQFASEKSVDFTVIFAAQANLSPAYNMDWSERGWFVYETLTTVAEASQSQAKAYLDGRGLAHHTFIAGNELYVWAGDLNAAAALTALPEVDRIRAPQTYYIDPIIDEEAPNVPEGADALAWGLIDTNADDFWAAFGVQGDGIVVANIDTGVQYDHPALDQAYKCWPDPSDPECWDDPSDICGGSMCDNNGHGTHVMGTMVADDDPTLTWQAGMAPNATWIACKGCESSSCSEYALNTCADWILAPDGDPANRPHVLNNSWGGGGCDPWYLAKVQAWRAAGIFPVFAVGSHTGCGGLGSPGDYQESFGSTGHDSSRNHAYAQGPSCFGHDPYTKPNITAPAVQICSTVPVDGWSCGYSGSSMAAPHAAGAVALLWSCQPSLIGQINPTFEAIQNGADPPDPPDPPCGAPPDGEGTYEDGYGYLDVYQAGLMYCGGVEFGYLEGYVFDALTNDPIEGASVNAVPGFGVMAVTDPTGYYTMTLVPGTYDVTASAAGYNPETVTGIQIYTDTVTHQDFYLGYIGEWLPGPSNAPFEYNRFDGVFNPTDELIYFPGGRTGASTHDKSIWTYDPVNDVWADTGCDMIENATNITAVLLENDGTGRGEAIYLFGGYDVIAAANIDDVQRYYPSQGGCLVEVVATDPYPDFDPGSGRPVGAGGIAEVNGKVYVFGGWDSQGPYFSDKTWEYDPLAADGSHWTELAAAPLSPARAYINSATQDGLIYAMGGIISYTGGDLVPTDVAEVLDPANPGAGWTAIASLPVATAEGRGFGFDADTMGLHLPWTGKVYVAGGGDWPDQSAEVLEYDIASDTWNNTFPELITARRNHAGSFVPICTEDQNDGLPGMWVFGGRSGSDDPPYADPEYFPLPCAAPGPPTVAFAANPTEGCDPLTVAFTDQSTGNPPIDTWLWNFGDGITSTVQHPIHTYDTASTYVVFLTVENPLGTDSISDTITVHPSPEASFEYAPDSGMAPLTVFFTNTSAYAISPTWDFGDGGAGAGDHISHTYMDPGTYNALLAVDSPYGCTTVTATGQVEVLGSPPIADFEAIPTEGCAPLVVRFTDQSQGEPSILTWTWDMGDGTTYVFTTSASFTHTYDAGDFEVVLTVENLWGTDATSTTITASPRPEASFEYSPPAGPVPLAVYFTNTSVHAISPTWDFGDGGMGSGETIRHTYVSSGSFTVTLTVGSPYGCGDDEAISSVIVLCDPVTGAGFTWSPHEPMPSETIRFTATAYPPTATQPIAYEWDMGDGSMDNGAVVTHTYTVSDSYTIVLTVTGACGQATATDVVQVVAPVDRWDIYLPLVLKSATGH
jgi:PKD repeat protein